VIRILIVLIHSNGLLQINGITLIKLIKTVKILQKQLYAIFIDEYLGKKFLSQNIA
jgi:hypothetical protein